MGVCLSKAGHGHSNCEEDGFCTPEAASEQYESPNPSGRYSYGLDTPRISADVGDLGALGSLFYKRGSRSRDTPHLNYVSPLEMFLGGVSGRNRVHHVNQMCTGDFSFASYLSSPLLKGFDVHAMEAVAKSYAESAAKAAARDAFVFLEENDVCLSFTSSPAKVLSEDTGDVDDDYAKSGESEDWEDPLRKSEDWDAQVSHSDNDRSRHGTPSNDRFDSVLNAVQARAKARRRQRRKSAAAAKEAGAKERVPRKMVRFQVPAESEEGCTDDDLRSCMESESEPVLAQAEADAQAQEEMQRAAFYAKGKGSGQQVDKFVDLRERSAHVGAAGLASLRLQEEDDDGDEFRGFSFAPGGMDGASGAATPLVGPCGRPATAARTSSAGGSGSGGESSADYYVPCSSLSSSSNQRDEGTALSSNDNDDEAMSPETTLKDEDCCGGACCDERQQHCLPAGETRDVRQQSDDFNFQGGSLEYGGEPQEFNFHGQSGSDAPSSLPLEKHEVSSDLPMPIPVGCVVVESRLPDGSRDTPQILELSDVELPEMSGNHSGFFTTRILHSGDSSPASEHTASDQEGSFTFPCLLVPTSSFSECSPFREPRGLWKDPPITDLRSSSRNHSYRSHPPPSSAPTASSSHVQVHLDISSPRSSCSDDLALPRCSFSFDVEPTVTKRAHEIVLPSLPPRSLPSSPGKFPSMPSRSSPLSPMQQSTAPYPPRSRRGMNKKLKFYSLERASFAAGAKRSKSPPTFVRRQRREDNDGDSSSDLFEIETMSGTNAMGSSRTPPSTPTKILKVSPAAAFDFNRLSNSIAQVSRSRSKRASSKDKPLPLAPSREKGRCLEKNRISDFHQESSSSLKGRAFLKLGLLRRSKFSSGRSQKADTDYFRSNETSGSEYLENKPPCQDPGNEMPPMRSYMDDEKMNPTANLACEWYCSSAQRRILGPDKRQLHTYHRRSCSEDRTFAVKN
ncbi:hypothetical protein MPTK1_8g05500 [Marchantia polymorpha subsp. ruderalis]|nr:hypothetical protein MARPO_0081s0052 [Marchantia polymorpha]BBN18786.1 hypothetical protein Mp_8g05500 [Marchantia polymorpha subsp. ruderalis]BBN18787.1 hypothetical protein Mp_8g05500 [Marchantia polymorpha subsp. ruderalis]|eukprot:PTQ34324.1 hypothetical protein MARPO_0081s0052 [Marchantia polymorpha]